jgi:hypothetical protein
MLLHTRAVEDAAAGSGMFRRFRDVSVLCPRRSLIAGEEIPARAREFLPSGAQLLQFTREIAILAPPRNENSL